MFNKVYMACIVYSTRFHTSNDVESNYAKNSLPACYNIQGVYNFLKYWKSTGI